MKEKTDPLLARPGDNFLDLVNCGMLGKEDGKF